MVSGTRPEVVDDVTVLGSGLISVHGLKRNKRKLLYIRHICKLMQIVIKLYKDTLVGTYPLPTGSFESMIFLFPRWDILVPWCSNPKSSYHKTLQKPLPNFSGSFSTSLGGYVPVAGSPSWWPQTQWPEPNVALASGCQGTSTKHRDEAEATGPVADQKHWKWNKDVAKRCKLHILSFVF